MRTVCLHGFLRSCPLLNTWLGQIFREEFRSVSYLAWMVVPALQWTFQGWHMGPQVPLPITSQFSNWGIWTIDFVWGDNEAKCKCWVHHQPLSPRDILTARTRHLRQCHHSELADCWRESNYTHKAPWEFWHLLIQDVTDAGLNKLILPILLSSLLFIMAGIFQ